MSSDRPIGLTLPDMANRECPHSGCGGARASGAGVPAESPRLSSVGADQVPDSCVPGQDRRWFFGPHERVGAGGPQSLSDAVSGVGAPMVSVTLASTGTVRPRKYSH